MRKRKKTWTAAAKFGQEGAAAPSFTSRFCLPSCSVEKERKDGRNKGRKEGRKEGSRLET